MTIYDWVAYLNEVDFTGVMQMGAPPDEHLYQAEELYIKSQTCKSEEELTELMYSNFKKYWGPMANDREQYEIAARKLWPRLRERIQNSDTQ